MLQDYKTSEQGLSPKHETFNAEFPAFDMLSPNNFIIVIAALSTSIRPASIAWNYWLVAIYVSARAIVTGNHLTHGFFLVLQRKLYERVL